jgi:hypothetical protein
MVPIATKINWILQRRSDIMGVDNHGEFVMVVPKRIYGFPIRSYRDFNNWQHPDYFVCEKILYEKKFGRARKQVSGKWRLF